MPMTPSQVFTPRSPKVNPAMYVSRAGLERALLAGTRGAKHLVLHGESGSGKSWLYKRVFEEKSIEFLVVNLADASRFGSIAAALQNTVNRSGQAQKTGYTESKSTELNGMLAKGGLSHAADYEIPRADPFEQCLAMLRKRAGKRTAVLVLDNLESIFEQPERIKELADLITLLDDESYSEHGVRFLIVGVPGGLQRYFYETPHTRTVGNRLTELPEVFRFDPQQTDAFVRRGFVDELRYLSDETVLRSVASHVQWVTGGIPQRLHEYCLLLANIAHDEGGQTTEAHLPRADTAWLQENGYEAYSVVEASMNEKATRAQRRNQVLFAAGQMKRAAFRATELEPVVRNIFSNSTADVTLNIPQIVADLESRTNPVLRRSPKGDTYVFSDPIYRMALRAMLTVDENEQVHKKEISDLFSAETSM